MRVNVIGKSNGVGLSRDLMLMADALRACGCEVVVTAIDSRTAHRRRSRLVQWQVMFRLWLRRFRSRTAVHDFDINVMMEHLWPEAFADARVNIAIPNPEWFDRHDMRLLARVDRVWAKTSNTRQIFQKLGCATSYVGFDSEDRIDVAVVRENRFFHLAGKSTMKGTERLLKVWRAHPHWPQLVVVQHATPDAVLMVENIEYRVGYMDDVELRRLQNQYRFHLCTSETEGWGHYLVEAMSVGAVILTVDAPPMNEFITAERGLLVPYINTRTQKQATCYMFDEAALVSVIEQAITMSDVDAKTKGVAARAWFIENKQAFNARIMRALQE